MRKQLYDKGTQTVCCVIGMFLFSVLQCQAGNTVQLTVTKHVAKTIQSVLAPAVQESTCGCGFEDTSLLKGIQYIEVLMENFVPGEMAMKMQLPLGLVLMCCVLIARLYVL